MKELIANCTAEEVRIAVLEDGKLVELQIERASEARIVGNLYKGRVDAIVPGIQSAFVDIGLEKNGYLHVSEVIGAGNTEKIEEALKRGQEVLAQVTKEAIATKGVKVSMDVSLPGRYLVYMPFASHLGVSKNITDKAERARLTDLLNRLKPEKGSFIIRSEGEGVGEDQFVRETKYLLRLWETIQRKTANARPPALIHKDLGPLFKAARDSFTEDFDLFLVDSKEEYEDLGEFMDIISPDLKDRLRWYRGRIPLFEAYTLDEEIARMLQQKVPLPSGGYLIVQEAETLTAIDVNTGKYAGGKSLEETVVKTNLEAVTEVARQIRLRNIGGIIVVDFIDMTKAENRRQVTDSLRQAVKGDKAKIKILPITRLGLIEMTRERLRESVLNMLCDPCSTCGGAGKTLSQESMYIKIKKSLQETVAQPGPETVRLRVPPRVAEYLATERRQRLEKLIGHPIRVEPDPEMHAESYKISLSRSAGDSSQGGSAVPTSEESGGSTGREAATVA